MNYPKFTIIGLMIIIFSIIVLIGNVNAYVVTDGLTEKLGYVFTSTGNAITASVTAGNDDDCTRYTNITQLEVADIEQYTALTYVYCTQATNKFSYKTNTNNGYVDYLRVTDNATGYLIGYAKLTWEAPTTTSYKVMLRFYNYSCNLTGDRVLDIKTSNNAFIHNDAVWYSTWNEFKANVNNYIPQYATSGTAVAFRAQITTMSGILGKVYAASNIYHIYTTGSQTAFHVSWDVLLQHYGQFNNTHFYTITANKSVSSTAIVKTKVYYQNALLYTELTNNSNNFYYTFDANATLNTQNITISFLNGAPPYNIENETMIFYIDGIVPSNNSTDGGTDTTTKYGICGFIYDLENNNRLGGVTLYLKNSSNVIINKTTSTNSGFYYFALNATNTTEFDGTGLAKNNFNVTANLTGYNNVTSSTWHYPTAFEFLYGESLSPYGDISMSTIIASGNASFVFRVYDYYSGYGISQAICEIYNASTGTLYKNGTTSTNIDTYGICSITDIPVGNWQLKVYKGGYNSFYTPYTTEANRTYNIDVLLATSGVPTVSPNPTAYIPTIAPTAIPSGAPTTIPTAIPGDTSSGFNYMLHTMGINVDDDTLNMIIGLIIIVFLIGIVITVTTSDSTGISSKATIPAIAIMALLGLVFNCITGLWPFWILPVFAIICVIGGIWYLFGSNSGG